MKNDRQNTKMLKGIKAKLLKILLPCIAIAIISIIVISYMASKKIIVQEAKNLLRAESKMNAKELETWTTGILNTLDMLQNTLETVPMDEETEKTYLATTVNMNQDFPNGVYIGDDHGKYIDMSGWVPDADYGITERDWYKEGLTHKSFAFGTPYRDADTGEFIVSATTLLKTSNGAKTVAAADVFLNYASKMVSDIKVMDDGYAFLVDKNSHTILAHKDQKLVAQTISSDSKDSYVKAVADKIDKKNGKVQNVTVGNTVYYVEVEPITGTDWVLVSNVKESTVLEDLKGLQTRIILILVLAMVIIGFLIERIVHIVVEPIKTLTKDIGKITDGDFTVNVQTKGQDEVAAMRNTIGTIFSISGQLNQQAENSSSVSEILYRSAITQSTSMKELNSTVEELANSVTEVAENTTSLAMIVSETDQIGHNASEKMNDTVVISGKGRDDMDKVKHAMETVQASVTQLETAVGHVGESTEEITKFVEIIGDIASQTNLLSLNAAIEAARAGEAGKGFAVVADEIRELADETKESTENIEQVLENFIGKIEDMVKTVTHTAETVQQNSEIMEKANTSFENIASDLMRTNEEVQTLHNDCVNLQDNNAKIVDQISNLSATTEEVSAQAENSENLQNICLEESRKITEILEHLADSVSQ